jgi:hypothetical protein
MAEIGEAFARSTNVRSRGQTMTAARWYHRSTVFPQFPMYGSCSDANGSRSSEGLVQQTSSVSMAPATASGPPAGAIQ